VLVLVVVVALFYSLLAVPRQSDDDVQAELRARISGTHPDTRPRLYSEPARGFSAPRPDPRFGPPPVDADRDAYPRRASY
jgi:hypothetical protein